MLHISVKEQEKEVQRLEKSLENRRSSRSMEAAQAEQLAEEVERLRSELEEKSEKLQAVSSGGVGASGSIRDLLKTSRSEEARLEAQDFSILQEITYLKSELEAITEKEKNLCSVWRLVIPLYLWFLHFLPFAYIFSYST